MDAPEATPENPQHPHYKFNATKRAEYLNLLRQGHRRQRAARAIGVVPSTVARYAQQDPTFVEAVSLAEMEAHEAVEESLYNTALAGNTTAIIFYLTNRMPDEWRDRRNARVIVNPGQQADSRDVIEVPSTLGEALGLAAGDEIDAALLLSRAVKGGQVEVRGNGNGRHAPS